MYKIGSNLFKPMDTAGYRKLLNLINSYCFSHTSNLCGGKNSLSSTMIQYKDIISLLFYTLRYQFSELKRFLTNKVSSRVKIKHDISKYLLISVTGYYTQLMIKC